MVAGERLSEAERVYNSLPRRGTVSDLALILRNHHWGRPLEEGAVKSLLWPDVPDILKVKEIWLVGALLDDTIWVGVCSRFIPDFNAIILKILTKTGGEINHTLYSNQEIRWKMIR